MAGRFLMLSLSVEGKRCVIVGAGKVAMRRATTLAYHGAQVVVIAPQVDPVFRSLPGHATIGQLPVMVIERPYQTGDLDGAFLVVTATDRRAVNEKVAADARAAGVMVNRVDEGEAGDVRFPASAGLGDITLAVDSGRSMPTAAMAICDQAVKRIDEGWAEIVDVASKCRDAICDTVGDRAQRRHLIDKLVEPAALDIYRTQGRQGYQDYCRGILESVHGSARL